MAQKNLKQKATSGMMWTALQKYSTMFIQFISSIILARLLTPYDYGCIGMLAIFMSLAESFISGGFGSALIQKKQPTQKDYSTVFFWNIGMASMMYVILFLSAPSISHFYNIPLLCDVLRVQGCVLFIHAFNLVQRNQLRKQLNFKVLSQVTIITSIISLSVTIFLAYKGFGVWALVVQNLILAAIPAIVFWFFIKWRPIWTFSWKSFKELFSFGFYMFLSDLLNTFSNHLQGLLIGRVYNATTMGYYSKAFSTEQMASSSISGVITQVTFPLYSETQDNKQMMSNMIRRFTMTLAFITFPLMFILLLCAKPIFVLLYSERWLQSVPYFQVLCIAGLAICLQAVNSQSVAAIGKSKVMFLWMVVKRTIGISVKVGGLVLFGMKGLLVGVVFSAWFSYIVNMSLVSKYVGYKWKEQISSILPITIVSILSAIASYGVGMILHLPMYLDGIVKFVVYVIVYLGWIIIFKPEAYSYFLTIIPDRLNLVKKYKR